MRWTISWHPHAAGTDRGNPRDAGERHACQRQFVEKRLLQNRRFFHALHRTSAKIFLHEGFFQRFQLFQTLLDRQF